MRIGIDARFYGSVGKGLGRYVQKLIENLEKIDSQNQYFIFLLKENFDEFEPKNKNFKKVLADYRWYTFSEQINMPRILNKYNLDLVHFPHFNIPIFYNKKFVITIHDLILLHFPTLKNTQLNPIFYWLKYLAYKLTIGNAIRKSEKIITVSEFSRNDIKKCYPFLNKDKIVVTYEACDLPKEKKPLEDKSDEVLKKYAIIKPYLLYVGNAYPHKNLERFLGAWDDFNKKNDKEVQLVLVGKKDYFYNRLEEKIEKDKIKNVLLAGFVPDNDLEFVYRNSMAYIFPSLYEGFGLPPLEAMSQGVAVASSDHGCMREVLGDSAHFFNGKDKQSIIGAIFKIINDDKLRADLIKRGFQRIALYSWKRMAKETLGVYLKSN